VITVISIAGVAAGVMALVIGIAINNGFRDTLQRSLLGATAHVMVSKKIRRGHRQLAELDPKFRQNSACISVLPIFTARSCWLGRFSPEARRSRASRSTIRRTC
jgi:ABC-type lipoprotein release transport system permease subunit